MSFYRELTPEEAERYRQWVRENYRPFDPIDGTWHPVVQLACVEINAGKKYKEVEND